MLYLNSCREISLRMAVSLLIPLSLTFLVATLRHTTALRPSDASLISNFITDVKASEIALMQFDSREPAEYWGAAALWNNHYATEHGHRYVYYTTKSACRNGNTELAHPWCKVLAMIQATIDHPSVRVFIYMDSDAVIDESFRNMSLNAMLEAVRRNVDWDVDSKPIVFNQDGPCWWCNMVAKVGYSMCLNAGTVVWVRHDRSMDVLTKWWQAALDSYEGNALKRKFRTDWPWEQDRQMAIYKQWSDYIQITSQPNEPYMQVEAPGSRRIRGGWCLSHIPRSGCFISHFCEDQKSKRRLMKRYSQLLLRAAPDYQNERMEVYSLRFD